LIPGSGSELLFATAVSTPTLGPTQLLTSGYRGSFPGVKQPGREVNDTRLHLVPRLRMRGAIIHSPHTSSWRDA